MYFRNVLLFVVALAPMFVVPNGSFDRTTIDSSEMENVKGLQVPFVNCWLFCETYTKYCTNPLHSAYNNTCDQKGCVQGTGNCGTGWLWSGNSYTAATFSEESSIGYESVTDPSIPAVLCRSKIFCVPGEFVASKSCLGPSWPYVGSSGSCTEMMTPPSGCTTCTAGVVDNVNPNSEDMNSAKCIGCKLK